MRFDLGTVVCTMGIQSLIDSDSGYSMLISDCLRMHNECNWGNLCDEDKKMNDEAVRAEENGEPTDRLMSSYNVNGTDIWIITEWDRSVTTVLLPSEY